MTPGRLLEELERRRVALHLEGAFLRYRSPVGAYTEEFRAWTRAHRSVLLQDWTCQRCQQIHRTFYGITERLCRRCSSEEVTP